MTGHDLLRLTRPPTLAASVVPVAVGTAAAALTRPVSLPLTLLMLTIAFLLQIATNMANEYFDYRQGLDTPESIGIAGVIVEGRVAAGTVARLAAGTYLLAFLLGAILAVYRGLPLLALGLLSILMGILYSAGPHPISRTPFGEAFVFCLMGPLEVLVSAVAAGGAWDLPALLASFPVGFLVAAILLANNLRDRDQDARHGRRTLPVVLGPVGALLVLRGLFLGAVVLPLAFVALGLLPWPSVLILAALPAARPLFGALGPNPVPPVARLHLVHGLALAAGLGLAALFHL